MCSGVTETFNGTYHQCVWISASLFVQPRQFWRCKSLVYSWMFCRWECSELAHSVKLAEFVVIWWIRRCFEGDDSNYLSSLSFSRSKELKLKKSDIYKSHLRTVHILDPNVTWNKQDETVPIYWNQWSQTSVITLNVAVRYAVKRLKILHTSNWRLQVHLHPSILSSRTATSSAQLCTAKLDR